jgi:hypothetical protein
LRARATRAGVTKNAAGGANGAPPVLRPRVGGSSSLNEVGSLSGKACKAKAVAGAARATT